MSIPPRPDGLASTVLIVDDDGAARLLMRRWLEKAGIIVTEVESGDQAIEQIEKLGARLGAVLLDVMLPGKDGFTVLSELRAIPEYSQLPVVVLSAHAQDEQDVIRSLNVGADDHIAKPFSGPVMVAKVRGLMTRRKRELELASDLDRARELASRDFLTGLRNRREFERTMKSELSFSQRTQAPLTLMLIDIDHFKKINDNFGHAEGDRVIAFAAEVLRAGTRDSDHAFRIGGEEFAIVLRNTTVDAAMIVADRLVKAHGALPFHFEGGGSTRVTISIGLAECSGLGEDPVGSCFRLCDEALYAAKQGGRNQVAIASRGSSTRPALRGHCDSVSLP